MVLEKDGDHSDRWWNMLQKRQANRIGHILGRNCFLKYVIKGKIKETGRLGRRGKQLMRNKRTPSLL